MGGVLDLFAEGLALIGEDDKQAASMLDFQFSCDSSTRSQIFQKRNSIAKRKFSEMKELSDVVATTIGGLKEIVPSVHVIADGLICKSRSRHNSKRISFRCSYTTGRGESAKSFTVSLHILKGKRDVLVMVTESVAWPATLYHVGPFRSLPCLLFA